MGGGAWSVADQGLFAGSNFLVSVLLARWLSPEAYGAYTVAFTAFLFVSALHQGALNEPMLVFGSGRFRDRLPEYLSQVVRWHGGLSLVAFAVLAAGGGAVWAWGGPVALWSGLLAVSVAQAGVLLTWLARSTTYITFEPWRAAEAGAVYAVLMVGGLWALSASGLLSPSNGYDVALSFGVMGAAGLSAGVWLLRRGRVSPVAFVGADIRREARGAHRTYGPWAVAGGGLEWAAGYLPVLWLGAAGGLAETGGLRALHNMGQPLIHVFQVMGTLMVPVFVRALAAGRGRQTLVVAVSVAAMLAVVFAGALLVAGAPMMHMLYDGKFDAYAGQLWAVCLAAGCVGLLVVVLSCLRALENPRLTFLGRLLVIGAVVGTVALSGGITTAYEALLTISAMAAGSTLALGIPAWRALRQRAPSAEPPWT